MIFDNKYILLVFSLCLLQGCTEVAPQAKDDLYWQKRNAEGVKMIAVADQYEVWTQQLGSGSVNLLLLHGGPGATHEYYENFPSHLDTQTYSLYFYDQLGSYFSDNPPLDNTWQIDRVVDEIETVRKAYDLGAFYLLGHSWGGVLAIHYALKYPEHLKGLILSNTPLSEESGQTYRRELMENIRKELKAEMGRKPKKQEIDKVYKRRHRYGMDSIPEVFSRLNRHYNRDRKVWKNGLTNRKDWSLEETIKGIATPCLIIGSEQDFIDPDDCIVMDRHIPNSEAVILPGAPHFPMWSDPERYFGVIDRFVGNGQ